MHSIDDTENKNWKYHCKICDYSCNRKSSWAQHLQTTKHRRNAETAYGKSQNAQKNMRTGFSCACGRKYNHIQSLRRHRTRCKGSGGLGDAVAELVAKNEEVIAQNRELHKLVEVALSGKTTVINNNFDVKVYLDSAYSNALNLTEFVGRLRPLPSDLEETRVNGYIEGVSGIILRGLRSLETCQRPIHCSDSERQVVYVRENNEWERDDADTGHVNRAIATVAKRQIEAIKEWETNNPGWADTEEGASKYLEMVAKATGPIDSSSNEKIAETIAREVAFDKNA